MPIPIQGSGSPGAMPFQPAFAITEREVSSGGRRFRHHQHQVTMANNKAVRCFIATGADRDVNSVTGEVLKRIGYVNLSIYDAGTSQLVDVLVKKEDLIALGMNRAYLDAPESATQAFNNYQTTALSYISYLKGQGMSEDTLADLSLAELQLLYEGRRQSEHTQYILDILRGSSPEREDELEEIIRGDFDEDDLAKVGKAELDLLAHLEEMDMDELQGLSYAARYSTGKLSASEVAGMGREDRLSYVTETVNKKPLEVIVDHVYHRHPEAARQLLEPLAPNFVESIVQYQPIDSEQWEKDLGRSTCRVGDVVSENNAQAAMQSVRDYVEQRFGEKSEEEKGYLTAFILDNLCETNGAAHAQGAIVETYGISGGAVMAFPAFKEEFWLPGYERVADLPPIAKTVEIGNNGEIRITVTTRWDLNEVLAPDDLDVDPDTTQTYARIHATSVIECTPEQIIAWRGDASQCTPKVTVARLEHNPL